FLMRLGELPFYILSCVIVFAWSRRLFGAAAACLSLALYVTLSSVTAHAGLATTDIAYTATLMLALYAGVRWPADPTWKKSLGLGVSLALMIGSKFSGLVHWPAAMLLILLTQAAWDRRQGLRPWVLTLNHIKWGMLVTAPVTLAGLALIYRFDLT